MKKKLRLLLFVLVNISFSYSQNYVSRSQNITNIRGEYLLQKINTYFTIKGDSIINTDNKRKKILDVFIDGKIIENGDKKEKWSLIDVNGDKKIQYKGVDSFTNKSWMIIYDLVIKEE